MIDCNICKHKEDYCIGCKHGELFERKNVSEPKKISVSNGNEYCGHCVFFSIKSTPNQMVIRFQFRLEFS